MKERTTNRSTNGERKKSPRGEDSILMVEEMEGITITLMSTPKRTCCNVKLGEPVRIILYDNPQLYPRVNNKFVSPLNFLERANDGNWHWDPRWANPS